MICLWGIPPHEPLHSFDCLSEVGLNIGSTHTNRFTSLKLWGRSSKGVLKGTCRVVSSMGLGRPVATINTPIATAHPTLRDFHKAHKPLLRPRLIVSIGFSPTYWCAWLAHTNIYMIWISFLSSLQTGFLYAQHIRSHTFLWYPHSLIHTHIAQTADFPVYMEQMACFQVCPIFFFVRFFAITCWLVCVCVSVCARMRVHASKQLGFL